MSKAAGIEADSEDAKILRLTHIRKSSTYRTSGSEGSIGDEANEDEDEDEAVEEAGQEGGEEEEEEEEVVTDEVVDPGLDELLSGGGSLFEKLVGSELAASVRSQETVPASAQVAGARKLF